jgi:hypothetical protein
MVKAQDLIESQKERENIKYITFNKIYKNLEKKIQLASNSNFYYVWYEIPEFIIGCPLYKIDECKEYIIKKIIKNGFEIEEINNFIIIKWFPK